MDRRRLAFATWLSELFCILVTILYTVIAFADISAGDPQWTSATWYHEGFCVWKGPLGVDSHVLCFFADFILGLVLALYNHKLYVAHRKGVLLLATVISFFNIGHGFGHVAIHYFPEYLVPASSLAGKICHFVGGFCFLYVGPYLGTCFGLSTRLCLGVHVLITYLFTLTPVQFAFGFVQLVINLWMCVPRLLQIGWRSPEHVAARVDDGWAAASFGVSLVMPVVFVEMLACESFLQHIFGHFVYDLAILVFTAVYSAVLWRDLPDKDPSVPECLARCPGESPGSSELELELVSGENCDTSEIKLRGCCKQP
eukprot:gnl/TRDRNA2_/TRDRNA2_164233_c0_seq1.p1 gnl/TRDRNA2_/TRDRNA2_164233_c0~~gnl/TRDRNA2_/TRDRNA2_164233_c0_seq1.p1  ORF type:complete len:312 (-),score=32.40 gnl/TRDRNA2_/TRDRNA2_164233_c0_seq1:97-1032(-)